MAEIPRSPVIQKPTRSNPIKPPEDYTKVAVRIDSHLTIEFTKGEYQAMRKEGWGQALETTFYFGSDGATDQN